MTLDKEQTEIFDFYYATSYNYDVHVLDYDNNDITPPDGFLLIIEASLT